MKQFNSDGERTTIFCFCACSVNLQEAKEFKISHFELFHVLISTAQTSLKQTYDYLQMISNWISGILYFSVHVAALSSSQFLLWIAEGRWLALCHRELKNQTFPVETQLRKKERKKKERKKEGVESSRSGSLWYSLWIACVDCIALNASTRDQRGNLGTELFIFQRNRKVSAQQRGLDFALVQARHSSKVISYFATKALSTSLFWSSLVRKSKVWQQESENWLNPWI